MRASAGTISLVAALALAPQCGQAQAPYPSRNIEIVVAYGAGGSTDFVARTIGQKLQERWNQSVVILNLPGGASTIRVNTASRAAPDGYNLIIRSTSELLG